MSPCLSWSRVAAECTHLSTLSTMKAFIAARLSAEETDVLLCHFRSLTWLWPSKFAFWLLISLTFTACSLFCSVQPHFIVLQPVWWYWALFAIIAASIPWASSSLSIGNVEGSWPSSLNWIKCSVSEVYPLPLSAHEFCKGHFNASDVCSWHMTQSFQSVLTVQEVDGPWTSKFTSWNFLDMFSHFTTGKHIQVWDTTRFR